MGCSAFPFQEGIPVPKNSNPIPAQRQLCTIGEVCGLHLDASKWAIPQWERSLRKRLSWALYMQDVWTALAHGRPSHISDDDWAVKELLQSDFLDCHNGNTFEQHYRQTVEEPFST